MATLEREIKTAQRAMKKFRIAHKVVENQDKPPLQSPDVLQTKDFTFSKFTKPGEEGDSGVLLLAKRKSNRKERYLIKHEFVDCAINEFVYTKLAQAIGLKVPTAKLFQISDGEKRTYFKTEYLIGQEFLPAAKEPFSYHKLQEQAVNWPDYYRAYGLEFLFMESDGVEFVLAEDNFLYRIDMTSSFPLSCMELENAGVDVVLKLKDCLYNPNEELQKKLSSTNFDEYFGKGQLSLTDSIAIFLAHFDKKYLPYYLEPFHKIQEIPLDYIDDFINTLCYFYPDYVGAYYKRFILWLQSKTKEWLAEPFCFPC